MQQVMPRAMYKRFGVEGQTETHNIPISPQVWAHSEVYSLPYSYQFPYTLPAQKNKTTCCFFGGAALPACMDLLFLPTMRWSTLSACFFGGEV